jgi:hypothetical protein
MFTQEMADRLNASTRYLMVDVLRAADRRDCTMNGISARHARLYVPHPEGYLERDALIAKGEGPQLLEVIPPAFPGCPARVKPRGEARWTMSGGNFVETSDSRFWQAYGGPVSVHDRIEVAR